MENNPPITLLCLALAVGVSAGIVWVSDYLDTPARRAAETRRLEAQDQLEHIRSMSAEDIRWMERVGGADYIVDIWHQLHDKGESMKKHFEAHESDVCDLLGLDATIASGARWHDLGDGVERNAYAHFPIMFDSKCTVQKSYSIQRGWFKQQVDRAVVAGKRFILPLRFVDEKGQHDDYVVLSLDDFAEVLEAAREHWRR